MPIKSILCVFKGETYERNALHTALGLTKANRAELHILHVSPPPDPYTQVYGFWGYGLLEMGEGLILDRLDESAKEQALRARSRAEQCTASFDMPFDHIGTQISHLPLPRVLFRTFSATVKHCLAFEGRFTDLIVIGYDNGPGGELETTLSALFDTGRSVLMIPAPKHEKATTAAYAETVVVAWDGSLAASRTLHDALSLMRRAKQVYLLTLSEHGDWPDNRAEAAVTGYLQLHGVLPEMLKVELNGQSAGKAILAQAQSLAADLLVMGAYGHSHVGEMILGGATDHVLKHANIPVFLSH
ncbi:hypothetical protein ABAC460_17645 [Asticcacaulis sp. AC460]|uniref:universal stress protein n=1 Tax=Asticcacaulis sp. AC460 TaxID=1282360 RepID=UPI0003C3E26A|nr:universal stress protein [Asticcacaulis sp. AC460]ESQ88016.1 hypothetical protein ABAC460_17645 [Asticcacaulis sp. AC460]